MSYICLRHPLPHKVLINVPNGWRRVCWSKRTLPWVVEDRLLYSDESRFNLFYNGGRARVWMTSGGQYLPACPILVQRNNHVSGMVWVCMGYHGVGELVILDKNYNHCIHGNTWAESTDITRKKILGDHQRPFTFQRDNASALCARFTEQWL